MIKSFVHNVSFAFREETCLPFVRQRSRKLLQRIRNNGCGSGLV